MKSTFKLTDSRFNKNMYQKAINWFYQMNCSAQPAATLALELAAHLSNKDYFERNFCVLPDLHEYGRFFYKFMIAAHYELISDKLSSERAHLMNAYFEFYFKRIVLPFVYEQVIYRNLHFADFSSHFSAEFESLCQLLDKDQLSTKLLDDELSRALERYMLAHRNYISQLSLREMISNPIEYGFIKAISS